MSTPARPWQFSTQSLLVALVVAVLLAMSGIAAVQFSQWKAIDQSNGDGRTTAQWEVFQFQLEHFKLRAQMDASFHDGANPEVMRQLVVRYNIFQSRYELLKTGQNAELLAGRPSMQNLDGAMKSLGQDADAYLGDESIVPAYNHAQIAKIAQTLDAASSVVRDVVQDSNQARAKVNAEFFTAARHQAIVAWIFCGLLMLVSMGFGVTAIRQMRLASSRSHALEKLHEEVSHRAAHDSLTGLTNRDEFERILDASMSTSRDRSPENVVLYIDLDRFKVVNDTCGHLAGDQLLRDLAKLMAKPIRASDVLARIGGDEFAVFLNSCGLHQGRHIAEQICQLVDQYRFLHGGYSFHVGASIGLVLVPHTWHLPSMVMQAADSACYLAKESGRNRVYVYRESDVAVDEQRGNTSWVRRLVNAMDEGRLQLYWQRIVPLQGQDKIGITGEILLRLSEDGALISPSAFLPIAERYALASRIDRWVVTTMFDWLSVHQDLHQGIASLAINLSGQSISDPDFQGFLLERIKSVAIDPRKLCLEVTETSAITNLQASVNFFDVLRRQGVRIALDDFGSGMSSFVYLKSLPVDYLKIDGQFMQHLCDSAYDQVAVKAICEVAHATGKTTVAEGVETEAVSADLKKLGVDFGQGFLWHVPEPLTGLASALASRL